jgi:hypothetical protein
MMLVQWFRRTYRGELIFSIPNGGHRSKTTAALLKATGVVAGVPDLFVPRYATFIEMKRTKGGVLSDAQKDIIAQIEAMGYQVLVCYGAEDAKQKLSKILPND